MLNPDLIILDLKMPGIGGFEFLKRLAHVPGTRRYPVLVLTAQTEVKDLFESGEIDGFVEKPCSAELLLARVRIIIRGRDRDDAGQRRMKVLLAESDESKRDELVTVFHGAGHQTVVVDNGSRILETAQSSKPHVIVMSIGLTGMTAELAAALLKAMSSTRSIPILVYGNGNGEATVLREVDRYLPDGDATSILHGTCSLSPLGVSTESG